jgi:hypothetical protein
MLDSKLYFYRNFEYIRFQPLKLLSLIFLFAAFILRIH